jgi:predicted AAA+ superfamily ATPase
MGDTRVVLLGGPRQAGKSTLAQAAVGQGPGVLSVTLDDQAVRAAAEADPLGFVSRGAPTMIIDEVQRVPGLGDAIKQVVDQDQRPDQFLLTGSASLETIPMLAEALVGRLEPLTVYPFSQGELAGDREDFIDRMFGGGPDPNFVSQVVPAEYISRAVQGGYPEVVQRAPGRRRSRWFASYVTTLIQRDLTAVAHLHRLADVPAFLRLVAARATAPLNFTALGRDANMPKDTANRWVTLLQQVYLVRLTPAWSNNQTSRASQSPCLHLVDTGLCAYLAGVNEQSFDQPTMDPGWLLENFVAMELVKQLGWSETEVELYHFRTRDGVEVDCVLEARDRRVFGIEVKSAMTVGGADFRGLRVLANAAGKNFVGGAVLYSGRNTLSFGDGLWAVPISALWA